VTVWHGAAAAETTESSDLYVYPYAGNLRFAADSDLLSIISTLVWFRGIRFAPLGMAHVPSARSEKQRAGRLGKVS